MRIIRVSPKGQVRVIATNVNEPMGDRVVRALHRYYLDCGIVPPDFRLVPDDYRHKP